MPVEVIPPQDDPLTASVRLGKVDQLAQVDVTPVGSGASHLLLSLPDATPPASYEGMLRVRDADVPLIAEVEPWPSLEFTPSSIRVLAVAHERASAHVSVVNAGNIALEIGRALAFGLFADEGLERAFGTAFRHDVGKGEQRFERFVEGLAEHHGGLVRVQVEDGAGTLEPGEVRDLHLVLEFPADGMAADRTYTGSLELHGAGLAVQAVVQGKAPERAPARKARKAG